MVSLVRTAIFIIVVLAGISGCVDNQRNTPPSGVVPPETVQVQPTEQPIEMMLSKQMLSDFCGSKNSTLREYGYRSAYEDTYQKHTNFSSTDSSLSFTCQNTEKHMKVFLKNDVKLWLISTGTISEYESDYNLTDKGYDIFCMQSHGKLNSTDKTTVTCYREGYEKSSFSGQDVAKWILQQQLQGD